MAGEKNKNTQSHERNPQCYNQLGAGMGFFYVVFSLKTKSDPKGINACCDHLF